MAKDYYLLLGLSHGADLNQIKQAYRAIAKTCHPDLAGAPDPDRFRQIQEAYETLSDQDRRRRYDAVLTPRRGPAPFPDPPAEPRHGGPAGMVAPAAAEAGARDLYFEVVLDFQEAARGCRAPIRFPVLAPCPACSRGASGPTCPCGLCGGRGRVAQWRCVAVSIPPHTPHGTTATIALEDLGLPNRRLHLTIRVGGFQV